MEQIKRYVSNYPKSDIIDFICSPRFKFYPTIYIYSKLQLSQLCQFLGCYKLFWGAELESDWFSDSYETLANSDMVGLNIHLCLIIQ